MLSEILFFGLGYFVAFIHLSNVYKTHADLRYADKVLSWHPETLSWRPVFDRQKLPPGEKYLIAFEAYKDKQE